jgi:hypothetical protein
MFSEPCVVKYIRKKKEQDAHFLSNDFIQFYFSMTFIEQVIFHHKEIRTTCLNIFYHACIKAV